MNGIIYTIYDGMAAKTSVNASLPSLHDKPYPSLGLCIPQAILEENPVLHIRDGNNRRHVLLQHYARKRAGRAVSIIRGIPGQNTSETISEGLKSKIFLGEHVPIPLLRSSIQCIRGARSRRGRASKQPVLPTDVVVAESNISL